MKKYLLLFALLGTSVPALTQHCVWDLSYLVVLKITTEDEGVKVPNMTINYLDHEGKVIDLFKDQSAFWPNPKMPINTIKNAWRKDYIDRKLGFWFAEDALISIISLQDIAEIAAVKIQFEDENSTSKIIPVAEEHFYLLCIEHSSWELGENEGQLNNFTPVEIKL